MDELVSFPQCPAIDNPAAAADARRHRAARLHGGNGEGTGENASTTGTAAGVVSSPTAGTAAGVVSSSSGNPPIGRFGYGEQEMRWRRCEEVGRGAHGTVYRALLLDTNESIAVKQIHTGGMKKSELQVNPR